MRKDEKRAQPDEDEKSKKSKKQKSKKSKTGLQNRETLR